jgi:hypothetical protein
MPLLVYASLDLLAADAAIRSKESDFLDFSSLPSSKLAETLETVRTHQPSSTTIYLGFVDPLVMLDPHHETSMRKTIATCRVLVVTSDPGALSLGWKNGISELHLVL